MANNRKKDKTVRAFAVVAGVLCAGALAGGGYISTVRGEHFGAERVVKADISSFEELAALGEGAYNDTISLRGDIRITDGDFMVGEGAQPFCGTFDGNGYTVYCDISSAAEGASLFGTIAEEGVVENTNFVFGSVRAEGSVYAALAETNLGTVRNCSVTVGELAVTQGRGIYSAVCAINRGSIRNVLASCTLSAQGGAADGQSVLFGALCVYNFGRVENVISLPSFAGWACTDEFSVLTGAVVNRTIGAVCSVTMQGGKTGQAAALLADGVYTADKGDGLLVAQERGDIFNESTVFGDLDFDNRIWKLQAGTSLRLVAGRETA